MTNLPSNKDKPFTVNGIKFANRKEYEKRLSDDINRLANFLYDIYTKKNVKHKLKS